MQKNSELVPDKDKYARLVHFAALLPLITAGFYLFGIAYHQGYLAQLHVEETLFPLSVDRTLFEGFIAVFTMGFPGALYALLAAEIIFVGSEILTPFSSLRFLKERFLQLKLKLDKVGESAKLEKDKQAQNFVDFSKRMFLIVGTAFFTLLGIISLAQSADKSGREAAERFSKKAALGSYTKQLINFNSGSNAIIGIPIECNSSYCAYWVNDKAIVISMAQVTRIESLK